MSETLFTITEHTIPAGHIREYPGSTVGSQETVLQLAVKQYTPRDRPQPVPTDAVTLIACHGVGLPKELYEPLWDEILGRSRAQGFVIRGIWIADTANHGQSALLNERELGCDNSWFDSARDLLTLVNHFRAEMPRPIMGVGHSLGSLVLVNTAIMHARLFTSLLLLEPTIQLSPPPLGFAGQPTGGVNYMVYKRDLFPSRQSAAYHVNTNFAFKDWDPRVRQLMVQHGFRSLPTALYPSLPASADPADPPVTYTTTKHQEVWTMLRAKFGPKDQDGRIIVSKKTHPDTDPSADFYPVYRPEPLVTHASLPALRPSVLWMVGEKTWINFDDLRETSKTVGVGVGGSGGIAEGRLKEEILQGQGHFFPLVDPGLAADRCAAWLGAEMRRFRESEEEWRQFRKQRDPMDDVQLNAQWRAAIRPFDPSRKGGKQTSGQLKL